MVVTKRPAARIAHQFVAAGSEMSGVPASDSSATASLAMRATSRARTASSLWS